MTTATRIRLLAAGLATFWGTVWMVVAAGVGWLIIGGMVTTALWVAALWGDLMVDAPSGLGEAPVIDHHGHVTVLDGDDNQSV